MPAEQLPAEQLPAQQPPAQPRVAGVLLAAGAGRRYGMPKALVEFEGRLLVERAAELLTRTCDDVVVVLGAAGDEVRARARLGDAVLVDNPDWDTGMGSSLITGLRALPAEIDVALIHLVDLPGMTEAALARVRAAATSDVLAVATYAGTRGHPVLLGRSHWAGVIATAGGDEGARRYLREHEPVGIECGDVADPEDLDRPPAG